MDVSGAAGDVTGVVELNVVDADGRAVKSVEVSPKSLEATVVMKALPPAKYVQVRPVITGSVREGFKTGEVTCEPKTVKVRGPVSQASRLTYVQTARVDVSNQLFNVVKQVEVIVPSGFTVEPRTVKVTVPVLEDKIQKTFSNIPIQLRGLSLSQFRFEVEPNSVSVTIEGRKDQFEDFDDHKIEAFILASGLQEGSHEIKVQVTLGGRDDLTVVAVSPEQTTLSLTRRGEWR
ncbi:MAG: YbbR-like domain-containing protein, partial [Bacillota bacterium]